MSKTNTKKVKVKWWNDSKGYGFVTDGEQDIFCHFSALEGDGFKTLVEGSEIDAEVYDGPHGPQVKKALNWQR